MCVCVCVYNGVKHLKTFPFVKLILTLFEKPVSCCIVMFWITFSAKYFVSSLYRILFPNSCKQYILYKLRGFRVILCVFVCDSYPWNNTYPLYWFKHTNYVIFTSTDGFLILNKIKTQSIFTISCFLFVINHSVVEFFAVYWVYIALYTEFII